MDIGDEGEKKWTVIPGSLAGRLGGWGALKEQPVGRETRRDDELSFVFKCEKLIG